MAISSQQTIISDVPMYAHYAFTSTHKTRIVRILIELITRLVGGGGGGGVHSRHFCTSFHPRCVESSVLNGLLEHFAHYTDGGDSVGQIIGNISVDRCSEIGIVRL